ncbi:MAG: ATP-dependent Clp protease adaptor ClpS [Bacteroidetes bacterium]|nr:ATP-dependent Clp protease adaptor ClpS [Bacteroidota bacterium]
MVKEKIKPSDNSEEVISDIKEIILFNDNFNTFDFVIETLIDICNHEPDQAEQCAMIVHYKGKCAVKSGSTYDLEPIYIEMSNRNLTVEIK